MVVSINRVRVGWHLTFFMTSLFFIQFIIYQFGVSFFESFEIALINIGGVISFWGLLEALNIQLLSMRMIFWFYSFIFFFFIPLGQNAANIFFHFGGTRQFDALAYLSILINNVWMISYGLGYFFKSKNTKYNFLLFKDNSNLLQYLGLLLYLIFMGVIAVYLKGNYQSLIFRLEGTEGLDPNNGGKMGSLIITFFVRPFLVFFPAFFLISAKYRKVNKGFVMLFASIFFIIGFFMNLPTSTARFYAFVLLMIYYTMFFLKYEQRKGFILLVILPFGIFLSFFLHQFRFINSFSQVSFAILPESVISLHFDGYEICTLVIHHIEEHGYSFGKNLLSGILFFIPSSFWPDKALGTGSVVIGHFFGEEGMGGGFKNTSCPLVGEVFYAFGWPGIVIIGYQLGRIEKKIDFLYQKVMNGRSFQNEVIATLLSLYLGLSLFVYRGDFLSSSAFLFAISFAAGISLYFNGIKFKVIKKENR